MLLVRSARIVLALPFLVAIPIIIALSLMFKLKTFVSKLSFFLLLKAMPWILFSRNFTSVTALVWAKNLNSVPDEDMAILDMIKNIAYVHIYEVNFNVNYAIIYLYYPGQKYLTDFCAMSNCMSMGHLYNPHMKKRGKR